MHRSLGADRDRDQGRLWPFGRRGLARCSQMGRRHPCRRGHERPRAGSCCRSSRLVPFRLDVGEMLGLALSGVETARQRAMHCDVDRLPKHGGEHRSRSVIRREVLEPVGRHGQAFQSLCADENNRNPALDPFGSAEMHGAAPKLSVVWSSWSRVYEQYRCGIKIHGSKQSVGFAIHFE